MSQNRHKLTQYNQRRNRLPRTVCRSIRIPNTSNLQRARDRNRSKCGNEAADVPQRPLLRCREVEVPSSQMHDAERRAGEEKREHKVEKHTSTTSPPDDTRCHFHALEGFAVFPAFGGEGAEWGWEDPVVFYCGCHSDVEGLASPEAAGDDGAFCEGNSRDFLL